MIFSGESGGGGLAVPADASGGGFDPLFGIASTPATEPLVESQPQQWPTPSTFAGRPKTNAIWDERREMYYKSFSPVHWKDGLERQFWRLLC